MNKALRKAVIAGNWKMNKNRAEAKTLIEEMKPLVADAGCDVVICVPYTLSLIHIFLVRIDAVDETTRRITIKGGPAFEYSSD